MKHQNCNSGDVDTLFLSFRFSSISLCVSTIPKTTHICPHFFGDGNNYMRKSIAGQKH